MKNNFIIYGAGNRGKWVYDFLKWRGMEERIYCFTDKKFEIIKTCCGKEVVPLEKALNYKKRFLIAIDDKQIANDIRLQLYEHGGEGVFVEEMYKVLDEEQHVFLREWCAYHHAKQNDEWFEIAEAEDAVAVFWGNNSVFKKEFDKLDLENVIEIACGWGRHVPHYLGMASKVTLVDILEENMIICKERFKTENKITYYRNNGYNLEELEAESYTAVFSYDSMVHFELFDVYEYMKDIYRVLRQGGKALLHHSNYSKDYQADFLNAPHARCFMDKQIIAYMAYRIGFRVVEQHVIDWYDMKDLDCITLLEKA